MTRAKKAIPWPVNSNIAVDSSAIAEPNRDGQVQLLQSGINNLLAAQQHVLNARYNKAVVNIELLAFGISRLGLVGHPVHHSISA